MRLKDKVAVITGAGTGMGRATAILFAQEGAKVVVADWIVETGKETVDLVKRAGGEAVFIQTDVSKAADVEQMIKTAVDTYGRLDILFNNAAILPRHCRAADLNEDEWDRTMAINLKSVFLGSKYAVPVMLKQGGGVIINNASIGGLFGSPNQAAYCATKGGVVLFTKTMAIEYFKKNIRVNCICPGIIKTPMFDLSIGGDPEQEKRAVPKSVGRLGMPEEIAKAALFLASDDSSYVVGLPLIVDGGLTAKV